VGTDSNSASLLRGINFRRPMVIEGRSPRATNWYASVRDIPSTAAASSTVLVCRVVSMAWWTVRMCEFQCAPRVITAAVALHLTGSDDLQITVGPVASLPLAPEAVRND
jgi:hypothetical protein